MTCNKEQDFLCHFISFHSVTHFKFHFFLWQPKKGLSSLIPLLSESQYRRILQALPGGNRERFGVNQFCRFSAFLSSQSSRSGPLRPVSQTLRCAQGDIDCCQSSRRVQTLRCAQGDRQDLQMSSYITTLLTGENV